MSVTKTVQRNSSIELLRIISMVMIVFHHFALHGCFEWFQPDVTIPHFWYNLILLGGKVGVNIFVLISGFFLINDNKGLFNAPRILKLWGQVFFYSVIIFVIYKLTGLNDIEIPLKTVFLPITFSSWGFVSTYFVLYLIHPFLNILLNHLDKKTYQYLLLMSVFCWSLIPTLTSSQFQGNNLIWYITLYAIAGYIGKFGLNPSFSTKHYLGAMIIFAFLTYLSNIVLTILGAKSKTCFLYATYFYDEEKFSILLISLSMFMAFATLKMNYHKLINTIASGTFGVYLIHDNFIIRAYLWTNIFSNNKYQQSLLIIPYSIMAVAIIFTSCIVIDLVRKNLIEKPYMAVVNKYSDSWLKPIRKIITTLKSFIFGK